MKTIDGDFWNQIYLKTSDCIFALSRSSSKELTLSKSIKSGVSIATGKLAKNGEEIGSATKIGHDEHWAMITLEVYFM